MLAELHIEDFAIIESLLLKFDRGFNVLTGETGAGKSIIIDAVTMLLGGRADTTFIRTGSERARIEGIFRLSEAMRQVIDPMLEEEGLEGDQADLLILGRELRNNGRNFCRINGSTVNLSLLEKVAEPLVDIHGQHEHLSLMQARQQLRFLDRYASLENQRQNLTNEVRHLRKVRQQLAELQRDEQYLARRMDQLAYQVEEIELAALKPSEEEDLNLERNRLANAEQLSQLTGEAYMLLVEGQEEQQPSITDLLGQVSKLIANLAKLDESWNEQRDMVEGLTYQVKDLASVVRDYADSIDFSSSRLQQIEERLSLIFNLKRKYGSTVEDILAFGRRAQEDLENISNNEVNIERLKEEEEVLRHRIGQLALSLSQARQAAAEILAQGVEAELVDLSMDKAAFKVAMEWLDDPQGVYVETETGEQTVACDETGIDRIEFLISPNPGEALKPLAKIASGGETSRIMLALKHVLASADETPTLIFDEIDQGIGGRIGGKVGQKLWGLARRGNHQVLCVTHLPQIAGYSELHYHVAKHISGGRTKTSIEALSGEQQVEELAQMLGVLSDSTRDSAREILTEAEAVKTGQPVQAKLTLSN